MAVYMYCCYGSFITTMATTRRLTMQSSGPIVDGWQTLELIFMCFCLPLPRLWLTYSAHLGSDICHHAFRLRMSMDSVCWLASSSLTTLPISSFIGSRLSMSCRKERAAEFSLQMTNIFVCGLMIMPITTIVLLQVPFQRCITIE